MPDAPSEFVAAIDLGSNSFHMVVGQEVGGRIRVVDRMKEMVRLAAGLNADNELEPDAAERALGALRRFGQRLRDVPPGSVRAVGTNTLRKAQNSDAFLQQAETALGHPIEIIAGREEARIIYLGVAHNSADVAEQRLVIDIGGGSTEFIIGHLFTPLMMESLYMGCVGMSQAHFADGKITEKQMNAAELQAAQEVEAIQTPYSRVGWGHVLGASGSILAVREVVRGNGWSDDGITADSLKRLRAELIRRGSVDKLGDLIGLQPQRAPVFAGGVAILHAIFEAFELKRMHCSDGALREGLLYDLQGRLHHSDMRDETIDDLSRVYHVDLEQANRVERTALNLRAQVDRQWGLRKDSFGTLLARAARLHEVGVAIAHNQYHKHGAYILRNADLAGFSTREQHQIGALIRLHRRKFAVSELEEFDAKLRTRMRRLAVLLRLAVVLNRSRTEAPVPTIEGATGMVALNFPPGWLDEHPLTRADLMQEAEYLAAAGVKLEFR